MSSGAFPLQNFARPCAQCVRVAGVWMSDTSAVDFTWQLIPNAGFSSSGDKSCSFSKAK